MTHIKNNELDLVEIADNEKKLYNAKSCFGICSNTEDGKHIVMVDFDNIGYGQVLGVCSDIINSYNLSTMYLVRSSNGYNAFSLTKLFLEEIKEMLLSYKDVDYLFVRLAIELRKYYVLRFGQDKEYIGCIERTSFLEGSNAHYLFFKEILGYPVKRPYFCDNYEKFKLIAYKSFKHGVVKL